MTRLLNSHKFFGSKRSVLWNSRTKRVSSVRSQLRKQARKSYLTCLRKTGPFKGSSASYVNLTWQSSQRNNLGVATNSSFTSASEFAKSKLNLDRSDCSVSGFCSKELAASFPVEVIFCEMVASSAGLVCLRDEFGSNVVWAGQVGSPNLSTRRQSRHHRDRERPEWHRTGWCDCHDG